jgi:hypothetical protein
VLATWCFRQMAREEAVFRLARNSLFDN